MAVFMKKIENNFKIGPSEVDEFVHILFNGESNTYVDVLNRYVMLTIAAGTNGAFKQLVIQSHRLVVSTVMDLMINPYACFDFDGSLKQIKRIA